MKLLSDEFLDEDESEAEIIEVKRPSSAAFRKVFSQQNQTATKRRSSRTQNRNIVTSHSLEKVNLERDVNLPAMVQAHCIQLSLGTQFPSFVKMMCKSYVEGRRIQLRLPPPFCRSYLSREDTLILEDDNEEKFEVKYSSQHSKITVGWEKFAVSHKLQERDVLVFHLVKPTKFKVYIRRNDDQLYVNPSVLEQNGQVSESSDFANPFQELGTFENSASKRIRVTRVHHHQATVIPSFAQQSEQGGSFDDPIDRSTDIGTVKEFQVKIRRLCLKSELDDDTLKKYYKLCCSKNDVLHNETLNATNGKLAGVIIGETVNIAGAVKACNVFTSREKLEQWENSLQSFKLLGMKVEFLVDRVSRLLKVKEAYEKISVEIENLKAKANMHKVEFQQVIDSRW